MNPELDFLPFAVREIEGAGRRLTKVASADTGTIRGIERAQTALSEAETALLDALARIASARIYLDSELSIAEGRTE